MKRLISYAKSCVRETVVLAFSLVIFYIIFLLGDLPLYLYIAGVRLIIFFAVVGFLTGFLFFVRREDIRRELEEIKGEYELLYTEMLAFRKEEEEYFLMWIHQMKTPIAAARLLLEQGDGKEDEEMQEKRRRRLLIQLMYIEDYANMAMNYLKLSDHQTDMDIAAQSIDDLIRPIIRKYASVFIQKHLTVDFEETGESIITDGKWFSILLEQLISNAVKYTSQGSVTIRYDKEKGELSVTDTGTGIPENDIPKIFDKGYSGFNGRINRKSSGLGLYLAKKIADRLSVCLAVKSEYGKGSCFTIQMRKPEEEAERHGD